MITFHIRQISHKELKKHTSHTLVQGPEKINKIDIYNKLMNTETERVLKNLTILGSIAQNDKLNTQGDNFTVYVPTVLRGTLRMWYGESRHMNIVRIQETVRLAITSIRETKNDNTTIDDLHFVKGIRERQCRRLIESLTKSRIGLRNLQQTYREDTSTMIQIQLLDQEIEDFLSIIETTQIPSPIASSDGSLEK